MTHPDHLPDLGAAELTDVTGGLKSPASSLNNSKVPGAAPASQVKGLGSQNNTASNILAQLLEQLAQRGSSGGGTGGTGSGSTASSALV